MRLIDLYALTSLAMVTIGSLILFKRAVQRFELGKGKSTFEKYEDMYELFFPKEGTVLGSICGAAIISMVVVGYVSADILLYVGGAILAILLSVLIKFRTMEMKFKKLFIATMLSFPVGIILVKYGVCTI